MNYRPYPDVDRALAQLDRGRAPEPPSPLLAWIDEVAAPLRLAEWQRAWLNASITLNLPKRAGRSAITAAIADQAVKAGEHVHIAGVEGVRCAGGDDDCKQPRAEAEVCGFVHDRWVDGIYRERQRCTAPAGHSDCPLAYDHGPWQSVSVLNPLNCPGCGHAQHAPGTECEVGVDHPNGWHLCLCLATAGASKACPPQMDCQGGTLGYTDIWYLRQGRSLRDVNGDLVTPDALAEPRPPVLARVVRTCTAAPSQWNAWTVDGQYLYLRYRSGIGTVDAFPSPDPKTWRHFAAGLVARFEHGGRYAGDMALAEFCERAGLQLADDAEVTGE